MTDKKEIFAEFDSHLMRDKQPSLYFNALMQTGEFPKERPFDMLYNLSETQQSLQHHPEGDVWKHTMLVVDNAAIEKANSKEPLIFMWAALLHDIGKPKTSRVRRGKITAYGHDKEGGALAKSFLELCGQSVEFAEKVSALVRWHMQPLFAIKGLPFFNPAAMAAQTDIAEVALLGLCDRLGRGAADENDKQRERENIALFLEKCIKALSRKH